MVFLEDELNEMSEKTFFRLCLPNLFIPPVCIQNGGISPLLSTGLRLQRFSFQCGKEGFKIMISLL